MDVNHKQLYKAFIGIIITGCVLILIVFVVSTPSSPFSSWKIHNSEDIYQFLSDLGWEIDQLNVEIKNSILPKQFDSVFEEYNQLQLQQGCDLKPFAGKEIVIYTIPITNYGNGTQKVYTTLIVHKKQIIGGDIHSAELNGFMHTLQ